MNSIFSQRCAGMKKGRKGEREKGRKKVCLHISASPFHPIPPSPRPPFPLSPFLPFSLSPLRPRRGGFTLLEVILALTILAGALAVLGEVSRLALRNAAAARDLARAQLLAESKLAEIEAGITSTDSVDKVAFDTTANSLDPGEPAWLYSINSQSTDEDGVISVRVTVTRDLPAGQHPVKFSLVRWLPDPNYTYTPPSASSNTSTSGGN